ncbi:DUF2269 domain-containing protein [Nocardia farcinica]|uniref:DUF2269 domain-containing protein n=1 Tax=Nocardia farcinica TaxID=37329 RepID=UPI001894F5E5|nr:DUF2269 domain-containing protein [Nocardia farcinica]MBF6422650.1 DUF2269 domain-containing protein [Nocardia farcinica]MBF6434340.1 DUF2269 domain-containing protein [Nocardia farcinica]MBF6505425.1 DUF2269 domain-containing protein [Nocardia farcinica]
MRLSPRARLAARTVHIGAAAGWFGAVLTYLVVAAATLPGAAPAPMVGGYQVLALITVVVLVPLSAATLVTGLVCSLGTSWGLLRHYWVLFKLVLNLVATAVLLLYTRSIDNAATIAAKPAWSDADRRVLADPTHLVHASAALVVLVTALVLAVFKPRGLTRYGQRRAAGRPGAATVSR